MNFSIPFYDKLRCCVYKLKTRGDEDQVFPLQCDQQTLVFYASFLPAGVGSLHLSLRKEAGGRKNAGLQTVVMMKQLLMTIFTLLT